MAGTNQKLKGSTHSSAQDIILYDSNDLLVFFQFKTCSL